MSNNQVSKVLVVTLAFLIGAPAFAVDGSLAAIPAVAAAFGIGIGTAQLTVSVFLSGFALAQIPMGFMADYFGRRRLVLICLAIFVLAGLLSSLSTSAEMLLAARFIQGVCAASSSVVSRATARDITEGQDTLRLMGLLTSTLGITMIVAPLIGGLALHLFDWRASFATSALVGGIGWLLALFYLPETNRSERQSSAMKTFIHSGKAFLASPASLFGAVLVGLAFGGLISYVTTSSDLLMRHYQIPPVFYAASFSVAALGYMIGGLISRHFAAKYNTYQLIRYTTMAYLGCAVFLAGFITGLPHPLWALLVVMFAYFACISAMLSQATTHILAPLPKSAGMATAILGSFQLLTGAVISLLLATLNIVTLNSLLAVLLGLAVLIGLWVFVVSPLFSLRKHRVNPE